MEKESQTFTIRRLFKEDMTAISSYTGRFDSLYFNPFTEDYVWQIMLGGAFWGVYHDEKPVALTYILPADSPAFCALDACWHFVDLLDCSLENSLLCGYLWAEEGYKDTDFYTPITKLWATQAARRGRQLLIHYMPAHTDFDMEKLIDSGFDLVGLRGLDNLVPHYIFTKQASLKHRDTESFRNIKTIPSTDTKTISMLCEKGYRGFDMDVEKNILFGR